jgi:hypothetical protein
MAKSFFWSRNCPVKLNNGVGDICQVRDDFPGIERIPSVKQERHFFNHSTMRQDEAVYPVDPALRCVGEVVEDE